MRVTGFDLVGVDSVIQSVGATFFYVYPDKGRWPVTHGAKAISGLEPHELREVTGENTACYLEATGRVLGGAVMTKVIRLSR